MTISSLVQLFFIILLSPTITKTEAAHAHTQCAEHEKTLLLELKNQLVFDSSYSSKLVQWNDETHDCCSWEGVECDGVGHVISLQLDDELISGGLEDSSPLFTLNYLEKRNLAHNYFGGSEIPRAIHKLTNLTHLNLSNASFGGRVPIGISRLARLVSLDISSNFWVEPLNLTMLLHNLTRLTELCLDDIDFSTRGGEWCHIISSSLPNLRSLSLKRCSLTGPLCPSLLHLNFLSVLRLDTNNLSSQVPEFTPNFSSLSTLSLSDCSLTGYFPEKIFELPTLHHLDLSDNQLLSGTIPQFPPTTSFRTIYLAGTNFSGSLPASITNLKNLSDLHLSSCRFTGPVPSTLSNLTQLEYVDLSFNFFAGSVSSAHFEGLTNLLSMDFRYNSLTGSIPESVFALPSLQRLYLSGNQFTGQVNEFSIVNMSNLVDLDLSSNQLEMPIPDSFFQLQTLRSLDLSRNRFKGSFQLEKILSLGNLDMLDLSGNNLSLDATGSNNFLDLAKQSNLRILEISNNQIAGELPSWIWEIGNGKLVYLNLSCNMLVGLQKPHNIPTPISLEVLDLHSNRLQGELPLPSQQTRYVDYSNNYFDSYIPNNGSFSAYYLEFLSFANNSLSGPFPAFICNCTNLQVLDLSVNKLSGSIPPCLFENVKSLQVLNLGRNNVSGRIPDKFSQSCNLRTLDLSRNNLVGHVPLSLENCNSLAVMNVGNNHIDDVFPCMLPSSLQVLVLRSNRFHGEVRCNEGWPNLQIIDIASNSLSGYLNHLNLSSWRGMMLDSDEANLARINLGVVTPFMGYNYWDEVMLIIKGLELKLVKIWPGFTSIDFSCNDFHGRIPEAIGELTPHFIFSTYPTML